MTESTALFENTETAFAGKTLRELKREHFLFNLVRNKNLVSIGSTVAEFALKLGLPLSPIFKHTIFDIFVGGENLDETRSVIEKLAESNIGCNLNYGVEGEDSDEDFDMAMEENLKAFKFASDMKYVRAVCIKLTGIGRFALFEKIQEDKELTPNEEKEFSRVKQRLDKLCAEAKRCNTSFYIDAEEYWIQDVLDELIYECMRKYNTEKAVVFDTLQIYRWDQLDYLQKLINKSRREKFVLGVKLVRGAYMEKERKRADRLGYRSPIQADKESTDKDYNSAMELCLENIDNVAVCVATHNEQSCLRMTQLIDEKGIEKNHPHIQFSQLFGMGDHITYNLAQLGFNANKYMPYGPVKQVIPYLIRRASENSSVEGQMSRELSLIKKELARRKQPY